MRLQQADAASVLRTFIREIVGHSVLFHLTFNALYAWPLPPVSESPGSPSPVISSPGLASSAVSAGPGSIRLPIICKSACCSGPYPLARKLALCHRDEGLSRTQTERSLEPNAPVRRPLLARTCRSGTSARQSLSGDKRTTYAQASSSHFDPKLPWLSLSARHPGMATKRSLLS
jgi:hypothetical protein